MSLEILIIARAVPAGPGNRLFLRVLLIDFRMGREIPTKTAG